MVTVYFFIMRDIMTDEKTIKFPHSLTLDERRNLNVTGVVDIGGYDEQTIIAHTEQGELVVKGEGLHIIRMSVEMGELSVEGDFQSIQYNNTKPQGGFFSRLFR